MAHYKNAALLSVLLMSMLLVAMGRTLGGDEALETEGGSRRSLKTVLPPVGGPVQDLLALVTAAGPGSAIVLVAPLLQLALSLVVGTGLVTVLDILRALLSLVVGLLGGTVAGGLLGGGLVGGNVLGGVLGGNILGGFNTDGFLGLLPSLLVLISPNNFLLGSVISLVLGIIFALLGLAA